MTGVTHSPHSELVPHSARNPEMPEVFLQLGTIFPSVSSMDQGLQAQMKLHLVVPALFSAPEPLHSSVLYRYGLKNTSFICLPYSLTWVSCSFFSTFFTSSQLKFLLKFFIFVSGSQHEERKEFPACRLANLAAFLQQWPDSGISVERAKKFIL